MGYKLNISTIEKKEKNEIIYIFRLSGKRS